MRLQLSETFGSVLVNRTRASSLRESIEHTLGTGENVIVDFNGVDAASPSVVDELFAKLSTTKSDATLTFENVPPAVEPLIRFVQAGRPIAPVAA